MPQSDYQITVDVERAGVTLDGYGGHTEAWPTPGTGEATGGTTVSADATCTLHFQSPKSWERNEGGAGGPGLQTATRPFATFRGTFPAVQVEDRLVLQSAYTQGGATVFAAGTKLKVLYVRHYRRTMQVDVEIVN